MGVINKEYEVRGNKELMTDKHGGVGDQNNAVKAGTWAVTRIPKGDGKGRSKLSARPIHAMSQDLDFLIVTQSLASLLLPAGGLAV